MAKLLFAAAIAQSAFFANPTWGPEGLPRDAAGNVIINRWIQPGESFWFNPATWVQTYQHYCHSIESAPKIEVTLPDAPAPEAPSSEEQKPEPAPEQPAEQAPAPDQAPPAVDQAEAPKKTKAQKAAEAKAAKAAAEAAKAAPAPEATPEADQADPAPDQADQADPEE